ncbi:MAG: OmpA family protein [Bacteroidales bacterium]|nr:OmpA family protein [Bacteroidales bacterium]
MRKNIVYSILIVLLSWANNCFSQDLKDYSPRKLKALGNNALEIGDTYSARDYYKAYCDKKKDPKVMFLLAECYRAAREYMYAANYYDKTFRADKKNLLALYHYGEMLKVYGYYDEAKKCFQQFKQNYKGGDEIDYKRLVTYQIISCDSAQKMMDTTQKVEIRRLNGSINKQSVEFSPMYLSDTMMVYGSLRTDTELYVIKNDESSEMPYRHFYVAKKKKGEWQFGNEWLEGEFNQDAVHSGNGALSPDGKRFYFTRCETDWRYKTNCKIYVSTKGKDRWGAPEELPESINMKKYSNTQPAVGIDSKRGDEILYFVSDRPDGKGGLDIWYSIHLSKKNEWKAPKNCGNKINTAGDEVSPFYYNRNKTLYFSSDGWPGLGELDVFSSTGEMTKWTVAQNLGSPINSGFDDLYYTTNSLNDEGFFTSNRQSEPQKSTCCDDIFSFKYVDKIYIGVDGSIYLLPNEVVETVINGDEVESTVKKASDDSVQYIQGTTVSLFLIDDESGERYYIATDTTDENGRYFFDLQENHDYVLQYESSKIAPPERTISTKGMTYSDTLHLEDVGIDYLPRDIFVIKNIYYDFDKSNLTEQAQKRITKTVLAIMKEYPQIIVEIGSHTDSKGTDNYNIKLSQRRAESVVNFLIRNGIDKNRLHAKGYGETMPIAPNEFEDGTDNPVGRAKNRRTEFRVIGTINQYFEIIYEE